VGLDGTFLDIQFPANGLVGFAFRNKEENLNFALGQRSVRSTFGFWNIPNHEGGRYAAEQLVRGGSSRASLAAIFALCLAATVSSSGFAAVDTGDNPPCAQDGICNLAVCDADPDCPDLPPEAGAEPASTSNTTTITFGTISCSDAQDLDIRAVAWNLADDWTNFERAIESATGKNLGNCTQDRFTKNGKVECVAAYDCKTTKDGLQKCML
jgi:hypothetical protein